MLVFLIKPHAQRHMKGLEAEAHKVISQLLHSWLVAHWRVRVWPGGRRFRGIHTAFAVDLIEMLGLQVIWLKIFVRNGPRGRDPAVVTNLSEIFFTQSE